MTTAVNSAVRRFGYIELVLVVFESDQGPHYDKVMRVAYSVLGVQCQGVIGNFKIKTSAAYIANIGYQLNVKLGGVNSELFTPVRILQSGHAIVFGVSVEESRDPLVSGIVAVVARVPSSSGFKYVGRYRSTPRTELSSVLAELMFELFVKFEELCGSAPDTIIYFRDSPSDGEMASSFQSEMNAITHAWKMFKDAAVTPSITCIVESRSHKLRAFRERSNGNVPVGTVIDTVVVDPRRFDFFLSGHNAFVGTSRPALYTVLFNGFGLDAVELERLCFDFGYVVGRSTRSCAVDAPTRYAQDYVGKVRSIVRVAPALIMLCTPTFVIQCFSLECVSFVFALQGVVGD